MISKKTVKIGANNVHTGPSEHGADGALLWEENIGLTKIYIWDHPFKTSACPRGGGVSRIADVCRR